MNRYLAINIEGKIGHPTVIRTSSFININTVGGYHLTGSQEFSDHVTLIYGWDLDCLCLSSLSYKNSDGNCMNMYYIYKICNLTFNSHKYLNKIWWLFFTTSCFCLFCFVCLFLVVFCFVFSFLFLLLLSYIFLLLDIICV